MAFVNERKQTLPMEAQTERGMFDVIPGRKGFVDLRPLEDDKTVLKNPHKGWFWHYIDNGFRGIHFFVESVRVRVKPLYGVCHAEVRF